VNLVADLELNAAQRVAVEHPPGPLLVVAGAGSGKTRVLTARVAWLIQQGTNPEAILAFTFTNRAAREMRERIERVVGGAARSIWIGTFHATAVRVLRREWRTLQIAQNFSIYDRDDQEAVVREAIRGLELPESEFKVSHVLGRISDAKNALVTPDEMERTAVGPRQRRIAEVYRLYQGALASNGALDFDDLIAETVRLFRDHPDAGRRYSERFEHVLVDEFQDTNHAQFRLVASLSATHKNLFAVGDDDQSIYGFRGAHLGHVLDFEDAFPGAAVVRLEQNYRSTGTILKAANAVIENNRSRKGKTLWSDREDGPRIRFVLAEDDVDEARRIRGFLAEHLRRSGTLADVAVLYRTNAQSRALETELRKHLVPYEIVGGVPFYQRREVKDLLAYLRLVQNPSDQVAFFRAWNTPRRGLGPVVRAMVEQRAASMSASPLEALRGLTEGDALTRNARTGALELLSLIDEMRESLDAPVDRVVAHLIDRTRYLEYLSDEEDAAERKANVEELVAAAAGFAGERGGSLRDFLAEAALVSDADRVNEKTDRVLMLTAHNAKGLEFPVVIVSGLEEGLFPHANASEAKEDLEEERRLFYVAITRAKDRVLLTAAAYRRRHDGARGGQVSRFVDEIPANLMEIERAAGAEGRGEPRERGERSWGGSWGGNASRPGGSAARRGAARSEGGGFTTGAAAAYHPAIGREVYHESFGRGVVMGAEAQGGDVKYTVRFGTMIRKILGTFLTEANHGD
jgi:DNA helicase II / ATP-dependent DNA helicase PcrA